MTATAPGVESERQLRDLYGRYKALMLAAAAALLLDSSVDELAGPVAELLADCRAAAGEASPVRLQLAACAEAAQELAQLVAATAAGGATAADLERVRAAHRLLRREVWTVLSCEYVPCCASEDAHHDG